MIAVKNNAFPKNTLREELEPEIDRALNEPKGGHAKEGFIGEVVAGAFLRLEKEDQMVIQREAELICSGRKGVGMVSALELLAKLGTYFLSNGVTTIPERGEDEF